MRLAPLIDTVRAVVGSGKGVVAIDESPPTCNARFAEVGIPQTLASRNAWRNLIVATPGLSSWVSGAILHDETLRSTSPTGLTFPQTMSQAGLIIGIKVDLGTKPLADHPRETITEGLDGLADRLETYERMGARFAKWRAVIAIGDGLPSQACVEANAVALSRYAALCQEAGLAPMVEPEVLMTGDHSLDRCRAVTEQILTATFDHLRRERVALEGLILKVNMILPGQAQPKQDGIAEVAAATLGCLSRTVPASVGGVAFLSGGQPPDLACARLNATVTTARVNPGSVYWPLAFSFARAIQQPALEIWRGDDANIEGARLSLTHRARCAWSAMRGGYGPAEERVAA